MILTLSIVAIACFAWAITERVERSRIQKERDWAWAYALPNETKIRDVFLSFKEGDRLKCYHGYILEDTKGNLLPPSEEKRTLVPSVEYEGRNPRLLRPPAFEVIPETNIVRMLGVTYYRTDVKETAQAELTFET